MTSYYEYRRLYEQAGGQVQVLAGMRSAQDVGADADERSATAGPWRRCWCAGMGESQRWCIGWRWRWCSGGRKGTGSTRSAVVERCQPTWWRNCWGERSPSRRFSGIGEKGKLLTKIELPSRAWWYRYVRWYARAVRRREGRGSGQIRETGVGGNIPGVRHVCAISAERPLHYVFADHCLLDVFVVDKASGSRA